MAQDLAPMFSTSCHVSDSKPPGGQGAGRNIPAADLAYLGDAVFELLVRDMLIKNGVPFHNLNPRAKECVSAIAQSKMYHKIFDQLTPHEQSTMKRGRNLHSASRAKSADVSEYRHATGLETLFGQLHFNGEFERMSEIFTMCIGEN